MAARRKPTQVARWPGGEAPAAFLPRFVAYLIDAVVVCAIVFFTMALEAMVGLDYESSDEGRLVFDVTFWATPAFWFVYQWACNSIGCSFGKLVMSIRVVESVPQFPRPEHAPAPSRPGAGRGFVRTLGQALGILPLGLGFWWALWDDEQRSWHDRMAGTRVTRLPRRAAQMISAEPEGIDLRAGDISAQRDVAAEVAVAIVPEGPRFDYRPHWSKLLFWVFVGAGLWGGLAAVIIFGIDILGYLSEAAEENEEDGEGSAGLVIGPLILAGLALASPFGVVSYCRHHSVELTPSQLRFHTPFNFDAPDVPYAMINRIRIKPRGGVEIRFTEKDGEELSDRRRTIYLSDAQAFQLELRTRFEAATGQQLEVDQLGLYAP